MQDKEVCSCERVEEVRKKKKAATEGTVVKDEDPYGGSTDENTDAEAEEDHPIPELPGMHRLVPIQLLAACVAFFIFFSSFLIIFLQTVFHSS